MKKKTEKKKIWQKKKNMTKKGRIDSDFSGRICLSWKKQSARVGKCTEPAHRW